MKQFVALSGLPRTGSTLLSSILSQNPEIHAEGNSAVCQLMWDMQQSVANSEQVRSCNKNVQDTLVRSIPDIYYSNTDRPIVIDKCRSWTLPANMQMLHRYFDDDVRVIVLVRPLIEIVASFMHLRKINGWTDLETGLLDDGSEPIMRSLAGIEWARRNNDGQFIFLTYDDLVDHTETTLDLIYQHCGWQPFAHNLDNIVNQHIENDAIYGLAGQHDVRPQISRRTVNIDLSDELVDKCNRLDEWSSYGSVLCSN